MSNIQEQIKKLPKAPGVYFFLGPNLPAASRSSKKKRNAAQAGKKILYIGKATSLKDRVKSYFSSDIVETRGRRIYDMVQKAESVEFRKTDSVLEALLLEAYLIKAHKPRYNTLGMDDKSFNYLVITKEEFPRVLLVRGYDLEKKFARKEIKYLFGPFPHGGLLKEAMRLMRKIFPYYDTKHPVAEMLRGPEKKKVRFNQDIGLYPHAGTTKEEYARTIQHIKLLFEGKKKELLKRLEREMKMYAKKEEFEQAHEIKRRIFGLKHIQDVSLIKEEFKSPLTPLGGVRETRIEAYDVAHLAGESAVGVMTVVVNGQPEKGAYRKFIIRKASPGNDPASLAEVLERRLTHPEWQLPRCIVVDGATAQINAAKRVLENAGVSIPIVGVVKDERHRPREIRGAREVRNRFEKDILLANSEAHRFSISFHRYKQRKKRR